MSTEQRPGPKAEEAAKESTVQAVESPSLQPAVENVVEIQKAKRRRPQGGQQGAEPQKVTPFAPRTGTDPAVQRAINRARKQKRRFLVASWVLVSLLPTLLVSLYFFFIAADQYASRAHFSVRSNEAGGGDLVSTLMGQGASGASLTDSYILEEYIHSRRIVDALDRSIGLRQRYDQSGIDWWMRFPSDRPVEDFLPYWQSISSVSFDSYTGIMSVEVRAFSAEDALAIASGVVAESEKLINSLSERARQDMLAMTEREVQFAEQRLRDARGAVATFRSEENAIDFKVMASAHEKLVAELDSQLVQLRADLAQAESSMGPEAPRVRYYKSRIVALEEQLAERKRLVTLAEESGQASTSGTQTSSTGLSAQIAAFEALSTEVEFAERAYVSALAALEKARIDAKQKHRYLATFVEPTQPTISEYPKRALNSLITFFASFLAWGIAMLLYAAVRDHVA